MKKLVLVLMILFFLTSTSKVFAVTVGLIGADDEVDNGSHFVTNYLAGTGMFSAITEIDARYQTPTVSTLSTFDSVLVWSNYFFQDNIALGNNLYDYVNAGGGVVLANFAMDPYFFGLGGNIMTYSPLQVGLQLFTTASLGSYDHTSPIMAGVSSLTDLYREDASPSNGATLVASWDDGTALAAWDFGGQVVGINMYPGLYLAATGDYPQLLGNALLFSASAGESVVPEPASLSLLGLGLLGLVFRRKKIS